MRIAVFGLGYAGCVSAACFAKEGHNVIGVDVNPLKVSMINRAESPIVEPGMDALLQEVVTAGRLKATTDAAQAILDSEISFMCVGTPCNDNGSLDLSQVRRVSRDIGEALRGVKDYHVVVVRSTLLPGSTEAEVIPLLEECSGKKAGNDFSVCVNPEFLREGTALRDFHDPPSILIGESDSRSGHLVESVYQRISAPVIRTSIRAAEMVKYASNAFHALKITFANEIGNFCKMAGIDSHELMDIFCLDKKLNLSPTYLRPGYAFGGSCLPKDLRALLHAAKLKDLEMPLLSSILRSNDAQLKIGLRMVMKTGKRKIGILGFSFKEGTDDLRESPMVILIETLLGKGYDLRLFDRFVSMARVMGANKQYIEQVIPHISSLMCTSPEEVLAESEVLVIGNRSPEFREVIKKARDDQIIVDLARIVDDPDDLDGVYQGICW